MTRLSPNYPFYLHDTPVKLVGNGPMGTWVEDRGGERFLVYSMGKKVYECLGEFPRYPGGSDCPRCSWKLSDDTDGN